MTSLWSQRQRQSSRLVHLWNVIAGWSHCFEEASASFVCVSGSTYLPQFLCEKYLDEGPCVCVCLCRVECTMKSSLWLCFYILRTESQWHTPLLVRVLFWRSPQQFTLAFMYTHMHTYTQTDHQASSSCEYAWDSRAITQSGDTALKMFKQILKEWFCCKWKFASFTRPHIIPNPCCFFYFSVEHKWICFEECPNSFPHSRHRPRNCWTLKKAPYDYN